MLEVNDENIINFNDVIEMRVGKKLVYKFVYIFVICIRKWNWIGFHCGKKKNSQSGQSFNKYQF